MMTHLDALNDQQKSAVYATEGPVLIVAGAGAGKTKTITHRILHLIEKGVPAESILAITFTNKAAKEMRDRVLGLLGESRRIPLVSTFHSFGVRVLKDNAPLLKLPRHFAIFDKSDQKKILKDACIHIGIDPKEHLEKIQHIISREKGSGTSAQIYNERGAYDYTSEITKKVWLMYETILAREGGLDFDDLLLKTKRLFETHPEVLARYQDKYQYIHIDEYQDTNAVQNTIVELLAKKHHNICVVGDTDQNIYSWRGAEIKNMLHFEKTYPDTQTIFLEQNYRSTKTILAVANQIIEKNKYRIPKKLFTENALGESVGLFEARSETDEAQFIALTSKKLIENGVAPESIAVLYRANFQSRALEDAFMAFGVPYQMLGTKFFERREVKDVISYIRASLNPDNRADFARIVNVPTRGIGKVTIDKIQDGKEETLPQGTQAKINNVRSMLAEFSTKIAEEKPSVAIKYVIERSGMEKMYMTGVEEDTERLENIMELVSLSLRYDELLIGEGMEQFLTDSALASDQDSLDDKKQGVKLMTVHSSKGLEFSYVFVSGMEADLFPHKGFGDKKKSGEDAEEERRLFYVAITRAEKKVFLTHAQTRTIFGSMQVNAPSEFLDDISPEYIEHESYMGSEKKEPLFHIDF